MRALLPAATTMAPADERALTIGLGGALGLGEDHPPSYGL